MSNGDDIKSWLTSIWSDQHYMQTGRTKSRKNSYSDFIKGPDQI